MALDDYDTVDVHGFNHDTLKQKQPMVQFVNTNTNSLLGMVVGQNIIREKSLGNIYSSRAEP